MPIWPKRKPQPATELERADQAITLTDWARLYDTFNYQGVNYALPTTSQETIGGSFTSLARGAYKANGVVFACMLNRMLLFSEARFQFRQVRNGRPGDLFGTAELGPLETPWEGATTGDLLSRAIQYADLAGNAFFARRPGGNLFPMRPDWVTIIGGTNSAADDDYAIWDPDATVLGYAYQPGGTGSGKDPIFFQADEVAHFAPIPDPEARFRGMSWLTPIVREVMADKAATDHKLAFFENGATPQMVVKLDVPDLQNFTEWMDEYKRSHESGPANAYKTLFLGAGADATVVGADLRQLEFKVTQGAGETRIAAAAGVPPVIVGLSEGLDAATYSNYAQARRRFADMTMRPLWRNFAGSMASVINVPAGSELWYDDRDIPALQEDRKDTAEILGVDAASISSLITAGYEPKSVVEAVTAKDFSRLTHTGLFSVQLQPPGTTEPTPQIAPAPQAQNPPRDLSSELLMLSGLRALERAFSMRGEPAVIHNHVAPAETRLELPITVDAPRVELPISLAGPDVRIDAPVNVEAARVEVPVHVEAPRVEVPVTVEAPRVEVEVPLTVEAPRVEVPVTVESPEIHLEPPRVEVPITVETPPVVVNIESPPPVARRKTIEFGDGRTAIVKEEEEEKA